MISTLKFIARHPLNRGRPLRAWGRFARWQIVARFKDEIVVPWVGESRLAVRRGMTGATGNIYCGLHEFADMGLLLHLLRAGDQFVDAGANVGSYTVLAAKVCGASAHAFEPDPGTATSLRRNIALNAIEALVTVHELALGEAAGVTRFTVGLDTTNHIAGANEASREVVLQTLDYFQLAPAFMKFDLEGFEDPAFRGAVRTLAQPSLLALVTELASDEIIALMAAHGFQRKRYDPWSRTFDEGPPSANTLFVRDLAQVQARVQAAPRRSVHGVPL